MKLPKPPLSRRLKAAALERDANVRSIAFESMIALGTSGVRMLFLINSGSIVANLTLLGSFVSDGRKVDVFSFNNGILSAAVALLGIAMAAFAAAGAHLVVVALGKSPEDPFWKKALRILSWVPAVIFFTLAIVNTWVGVQASIIGLNELQSGRAMLPPPPALADRQPG